MRVGIYGGTFNPPHRGHEKAISSAAQQLELDLVVIVPTGIPPHKDMPEGSPDGDGRLEMAEIAFAQCDFAEVIDNEVKRAGKSYTVDTIREISKKYPVASLFLLMGTDMFSIFDIWKDYDKIIEMATPSVFQRGANDADIIREKASQLRDEYGITTEIVENDAIEVSSSGIRDMLPNRCGAEYLSNDVYAYILKNKLYRVKPSFDWLRQEAYKRLPSKRIPHVAGCEQEAVALAKHWGASEDDAREAAILHDITKGLDLDNQLILCRKYDIMCDNVEMLEYKLLHAKTGAAIARAEFGVSDSVHDAIFWHTTGGPDMTLLEKVIYIADYIEPSRDFEGLSALRKLAYEDLDSAMGMGLKMSIDDMLARGIVPHSRSLEALEFYG